MIILKIGSIYDRTEVNVTFFNEFGEHFEKALKENQQEEVVVVIASAKVNKYEGIYLFAFKFIFG